MLTLCVFPIITPSLQSYIMHAGRGGVGIHRVLASHSCFCSFFTSHPYILSKYLQVHIAYIDVQTGSTCKLVWGSLRLARSLQFTRLDMESSNALLMLLLSAVLRTAFSSHFEGAIIQWRPAAVQQSSGIAVSTVRTYVQCSPHA